MKMKATFVMMVFRMRCAHR